MKIKIKWSEVMNAAAKCGFTDEDYGLIGKRTKIHTTIGVEEYAVGENIKRLLETIGFEVEVDATCQDQEG